MFTAVHDIHPPSLAIYTRQLLPSSICTLYTRASFFLLVLCSSPSRGKKKKKSESPPRSLMYIFSSSPNLISFSERNPLRAEIFKWFNLLFSTKLLSFIFSSACVSLFYWGRDITKPFHCIIYVLAQKLVYKTKSNYCFSTKIE